MAREKAYISSVLGCHFQTIMAGINEITKGTETPKDRIRKPGGGNKENYRNGGKYR
jgi:hypothetical protein